jgi:hypothetical protein
VIQQVKNFLKVPEDLLRPRDARKGVLRADWCEFIAATALKTFDSTEMKENNGKAVRTEQNLLGTVMRTYVSDSRASDLGGTCASLR